MEQLRIEVVDSTCGRWATGMRVDVFALGAGARKLCSGVVNAEGVVDDPVLAEAIVPGEYEVVFHVGPFFGQRDAQASAQPLLDTVPFRFSIAGTSGYRLPVRVAPWEFALER
ncbi:MAG TPA: hydroxyisourate hydrolase [Casimicrobiaceae bacterium]